MTIKLSEEQLQKYGFTSQEQLIAKLDQANQPQTPVPSVAPAPVASDPAAMQWLVDLARHDARLNALEAAVKLLGPESILASVSTEARKVAALEISAAIARSGGAAIAQKSDPTEPPSGKPAINPSDFGAIYDTDESVRDQFPTKGSYVKYREGVRDGRIRETINRN